MGGAAPVKMRAQTFKYRSNDKPACAMSKLTVTQQVKTLI